jgi:hypothetical protein
VISDENNAIFAGATQKLSSTDVLQIEAHTTLLVVRLIASIGFGPISVEGDALLLILAINSISLSLSLSLSLFLFFCFLFCLLLIVFLMLV